MRAICAALLCLCVVSVAAYGARTDAGPEMGDIGVRPPDAHARLACEVITRGNSGSRWLALTFDDGPELYFTSKLLAILKECNAPATFFVVGEKADRYPELIQKIQADGHELANHTYYHLRLSQLEPSMVEWEMRQGAETLQRLTGKAPRFFRPPGGDLAEVVQHTAARMGAVVALWTQAPGDYELPEPGVLLQRLKQATRPGSVILLHEMVIPTMQALPEYIRWAQQNGYRFVTLSQMHHATASRTQPRRRR